MAKISSQFIEVEGLRLHCLVAGEALGDPVLLLHGWPTNAQLWRHVLAQLGEHRRVIALDLPGYGLSDKPTDVRYSFRFFQKIIDGTLDALQIDELSLGVHDAGGPIGMYWAAHNQPRVRSLALLNTLVFPEMSWAVKAFFLALRTPGLSRFMTSPRGIATAIRLGVVNRDKIDTEVAALYQAPYRDRESRAALLHAAKGLSLRGFHTIAKAIPELKIPVRIIYGEIDRALPDVAKTMARVQTLVPHAELTSLPNIGHFLQEDAPEEVAALVTEFFARSETRVRQSA
ncbi:MAG: alpha/beta fold hydrolase [Myxococcota bacterium]